MLLVRNTKNQCEYQRRVTDDICDWDDGEDQITVFVYPVALKVIAALIASGTGYNVTELCAECVTVLFNTVYHPAPGLEYKNELVVHCFRNRRDQ